MLSSPLKNKISVLVAGLIISGMISGCSKKSTPPADREVSEPIRSDVRPEDKPLAEFQKQLLDLAFEAACSIPVHPFSKDRSAAQQEVVTACLVLDQPIRAARYADRIEDWRRGLCYAKVSFYLAGKGYDQAYVKPGLELAERIAALDHGQQWRSDRIKSVIAQTYLALGQSAQAASFGDNLQEGQDDELSASRTAACSSLSLEEHLKRLDEVVALGHFDMAKGILSSYAVLYNQFYNDPDKRRQIEEKVRAAWDSMKLPMQIRLESLMKLIHLALEHDDRTQAMVLVHEAQSFLKDHPWTLEKYIQLTAQLMKLQFRAGDVETARQRLDAATAFYDENFQTVVDIDRAGILRSLAETYQAIGASDTARQIYRRALEAGFVNPNLMPRAKDLSATCTSMAVTALEPDEQMWAQIQSKLHGLAQL